MAPTPQQFGRTMPGYNPAYALGPGMTITTDLEKDLGFKSTPVQRTGLPDWTQANQSRGYQDDTYQRYLAMANGTGPSLAQGQLQQATDSNIANAMALGAAQQGQGLGYSSALRQIADQSAAARQQAAAQSAMIRNAEQMQGIQGMGGISGQMRGLDQSQQQIGSSLAFGYDQLQAQLDAAAQQRKAQTIGSGLNAAGSALAPSGPLTGLLNAIPGMSSGGCVPGYARGGQLDSTANDTVPAMLSPGEIVLPRSITMAPDAEERAKMFVQQILARRKRPQESGEHPALRDMARRKAA